MTIAFVFPGQGSQAVGMGKGLAETFAPARRVFEEVDAALGEKLSETMWNGPAESVNSDRECATCADGGLARRVARA